MERLVLSNLLFNEEYARKTIPFLKKEYFENQGEALLFSLISDYSTKYSSFPSPETLTIELKESSGISETAAEIAGDLIGELGADKENELPWLLDKTEEWCKKRAIINAMRSSITIIDDAKKAGEWGKIPELLQNALNVSFDTSVGHDFIKNAPDRFELYHRKEEKLRFSLEHFNKITRGGFSRKTLNIYLAACVHPDTKVRIRYRKRNQT